MNRNKSNNTNQANDLADSNNNNNHSSSSQTNTDLDENMNRETESVSETMTIISSRSPYPSLTVIGKSHISNKVQYELKYPTFFTIINNK